MPLVFGAGAELTGRISALWADIGRASLPLRTICLLHALRVRHALPNAIDLSRGVGATSFVLLAAADVEREATLHGVGPAPRPPWSNFLSPTQATAGRAEHVGGDGKRGQYEGRRAVCELIVSSNALSPSRPTRHNKLVLRNRALRMVPMG
jgi:hypothetical protein